MLSSATVNVPVNFAGMTIATGNDAIPLQYSVNRTWDFGSESLASQVLVKNINPSSGVFDWTCLDRFINASVGKDIIFCLGQPADWMILRAAVGGASKSGKANLCPTGTTELANYIPAVTAIVQRMKNTYGRTGVRWELWNEFNETKYYADAYSALGPYTKAVAEAIKAVDPTAKILTPSTSYNLLSSQDIQTNFLLASDGAGGKAGQYCDELSIHYYNDSTDPSSDNVYRMFRYTQSAKNSLGLAGMSMPLINTESGWLVDDNLQLYITKLKRRLLFFAAMGFKAYVGYAANIPVQYPVFSLNNPLSIADAWNEMVARISGATISGLIRNPDGSLTAVINGSQYTV